MTAGRSLTSPAPCPPSQEASEVADRRLSRPPPPFSEYARMTMMGKIGDGSFQEFLEGSLAMTDDFGSGGSGGGQAKNPVDAGWEW